MHTLGLLASLTLAGLAFAQNQDPLSKRYGFEANLAFYPQKSPQDTLLSAVKAIENKRIDYLLAQLADPRFVDESVANYKTTIREGGDKAKLFLAFDRLVLETTQYFLEDPTLLKELRRFGKEGEFDTNEHQATGTLKTVQGRKVFLRKIDDRWFLENRQQ